MNKALASSRQFQNVSITLPGGGGTYKCGSTNDGTLRLAYGSIEGNYQRDRAFRDRHRENGSGSMGGRSFLGWIVIGLVAGVLGKLLMPGRDPGGFIVTILLGIAGALLAGFVGQAMGWYAQGKPAGWIAATLGAIALLAIYRVVMRGRA